MKESRSYFGTDGIRGTVGTKPINPEFMLRLGHAVGAVLKRHIKSPSVLIGKDTRISGYMIESALQAGFISAGVNVALTGPLPTPAVAYLTRAMRLDLGVVISASHNPFEDNGVKFFSADGKKLPDMWEAEIESLLEDDMHCIDSFSLGKAIRIDDAAGRYIEFCKSTVSLGMQLKGLKIVVDAAHGAAYHTAKSVFHELGADVTCTACEPDGININDGVGATHPAHVVERVKERGADYGISLDGDADRVQMCDSTGRLFNGDELMYIMAMDRKAAGLPIHGVVGTVMTNVGIEQALEKQDIQLVRAKVGDRYVLEQLEKCKWEIGGESSGHLLDLSKHTTGDGTISALLVLQAVIRQGKSMAKLLEGVKMYSQCMVNVKIPKGASWESPALEVAMRNTQDELGPRGRILIRPSGTEPVVRVMVEDENHYTAKTAAGYLSTTLKANAA